MDIIKVDAIDSTNTFLRELNRQKQFEDSVCVLAKEQLAGKGQMGTIWQSEPGKNLTCSVFMKVEGIQLTDQFFVSMATSLAVCDTLNDLMITKLSIKWPNDILSDRQKICGILIENVVKNGSLTAAILGIGINVNQIQFDNLPQAGSLKQILGKNFDVEEVLHILLSKLKNRFLQLKTTGFSELKKEYETLLFRKNKPSTFLDAEGNSFVGIIQAVNDEGKLLILLEDDIIQAFDLKEISLLY